MNKLIFADPHIKEEYISELDKIFQEILQKEATQLIMLGDYYDKKRPTAKEILFGTKWVKKFKEKFKDIIFLRGNHDRTQEVSAIDYLQYFGIKIVNDYTDEYNNFYGHFMIEGSKFQYGIYKYTISQLAQYNMVFLGHQHSYQEIAGHIWHIGSVRYVGFGEVSDNSKYILKLGEKPEFIPLKSPIPMQDIKSIQELPNIGLNTKVRLIISSFDQFKREINEISKWKNKFVDFKIKLEFRNIIERKEEKTIKYKEKKLQDIINTYIKKIEDKDVRSLLQETYEKQ